MGYAISRYGGAGGRPVDWFEFIVDEDDDLALLSKACTGSLAYCVDDGKTYIKNLAGSWVERGVADETVSPPAGYSVVQIGGFDGHPGAYAEYVVSTDDDLTTIPGAAAGSTAYCLEDGKTYIVGSDGSWDEYTGSDAGGGGGSSGGGLFVTTVTYASSAYASDHTAQEICDAYAAGLTPIMVYNGNIYSLQSVDSSTPAVSFSRLSYVGADGVYETVFYLSGASSKVPTQTQNSYGTPTASHVAVFLVEDDGSWSILDAGGVSDISLFSDGTVNYGVFADQSDENTQDNHRYALTDYSEAIETVDGDDVTVGTAHFTSFIYNSSDAVTKIATFTISDTTGAYEDLASATIAYTETTL